jgi:hypothetical protein
MLAIAVAGNRGPDVDRRTRTSANRRNHFQPAQRHVYFPVARARSYVWNDTSLLEINYRPLCHRRACVRGAKAAWAGCTPCLASVGRRRAALSCHPLPVRSEAGQLRNLSKGLQQRRAANSCKLLLLAALFRASSRGEDSAQAKTDAK